MNTVLIGELKLYFFYSYFPEFLHSNPFSISAFLILHHVCIKKMCVGGGGGGGGG